MMTGSPLLRERLEGLYQRLNRREYVRPDPLEFLFGYPDLSDREVVGLVAAALAYGRVAQIYRSVASVLGPMGPQPGAFLLDASRTSLDALYCGFRHRFTTGEELVALLWGARRLIRGYGSLEACFVEGLHPGHETVLPALSAFVHALAGGEGWRSNSLIPLPDKGSACKRLNLFLRWMVRKDDVDPGGWERVEPSRLIVPLDTHMHRISLALALTGRKQPAMRAALEVTAAFRSIAPHDPVRYDFALTRLGIREEEDIDAFLKDCTGQDPSAPRRSIAEPV